MSITFPKHYKTPEELVELLSERGLYIHDKDSACQYIKNIGYYRLSAYLYPFWNFLVGSRSRCGTADTCWCSISFVSVRYADETMQSQHLPLSSVVQSTELPLSARKDI